MSKRVALVTGGMGGLGTAICRALAEGGFVVVANCLPGFSQMEDWLAQNKSAGFEFHAAEGNVADYASCNEMVKRIESEMGPVDVLVNNAGITRDNMFRKMLASDPEFNCVEPCFSADGKRLFFLSTLPPAGEQPKRGWGHQNIWVVDRQADGSWGKPYGLGQPINTPDQEYFPSLTRDGTLYFSRSVASAPSAVYRSRLVNNVYSSPEKLPSPVNGSWSIYNACIAPDESYLIGCVSGKDTTLPKNVSRYYDSFRSRDGSWSELIDMGDMINP